jgi:hypothetical protein
MVKSSHSTTRLLSKSQLACLPSPNSDDDDDNDNEIKNPNAEDEEDETLDMKPPANDYASLKRKDPDRLTTMMAGMTMTTMKVNQKVLVLRNLLMQLVQSNFHLPWLVEMIPMTNLLHQLQVLPVLVMTHLTMTMTVIVMNSWSMTWKPIRNGKSIS